MHALLLPLAAALLQGPPAGDLLYGQTEVVVRSVEGADRIEVFLDAYPDPICRLPGSGGSCPFDAGSTFESRRIRAVASGAAGQPLAEDVVVTRGFPAPVRVEARSLLVPVVAEPPLAAEDFACWLGKEPCRVVGILPPTDPKAPEISIAVLVDVSGSMRADRRVLRDRLMDLLGWLPEKATVSLAKFSSTYAEVVPPTRDASVLRAGLDALEDEFETCLWRALGEALDTLAARPGLRVLLLVSDGQESCSPKSSQLPPDVAIRAVRRSASRLYIFRSGHFSRGHALESLAVESGGRVFGRGGFVGLEKALAAIANDLARTFLADIEPGPDYRDGERLTLRHRAEKPIVTPVYVPATSEQRHLTVLASGDGEARRSAASRLAEAPTRVGLRGLSQALEDTEAEPDLLDAFARCAAALLLHGNVRDQDAALDAAERLANHGVELPETLAAALRVYPKTAPEERDGRRATVLGRETTGIGDKRKRK
jgi:hypothetical protein